MAPGYSGRGARVIQTWGANGGAGSTRNGGAGSTRAWAGGCFAASCSGFYKATWRTTGSQYGRGLVAFSACALQTTLACSRARPTHNPASYAHARAVMARRAESEASVREFLLALLLAEKRAFARQVSERWRNHLLGHLCGGWSGHAEANFTTSPSGCSPASCR